MSERGDPAQPHPLPEDWSGADKGFDERPAQRHGYVHFLDARDSRPVNPNTPEGEIRNMAAFAAGVHAAPPLRRAVTKAVVWLVLIGIAFAIVAGVINGFRAF